MARAILRRGKDRRLKDGHPWVYAGEIERVEGGFNPGDIVDVVNSAGFFLGRGYINPFSQIAIRVLTWRDEAIDEGFFHRRIARALDYRRRVMPEATSFRVVFGEGDFLPALIVDKYEDHVVLQTLALGMDQRKDWILAAIQELLKPRVIYERNDVAVRELEGLPVQKGPLLGVPDGEFLIRENGLAFHVDVVEGQKTGYFLDQKENRRAIAPFVDGARVLDAFCNTGTFSIHAAHYGAKEVTGLDISEPAVRTAYRNAAVNGLGERCRFEVGNAFDLLRKYADEKVAFDTVILDPPAFAKNRQALAGAVRGYKEINLRAMKLLPPGGVLITCSCSHHMTEDLFVDTVLMAARDAKKELRRVALRTQAADHPILLGVKETYYLKCLVLQVF
ncbi:MAG: class I SAM-dependent rRNA methyltransferase [Firmicutes bacterium]|nr:class I SAM-dependent rRNA methyltransferase [Bacillota bacterium]